MLEKREINDLQWVDTKNQIADVIRKERVCPQNIEKYVTGELGKTKRRRERRKGKLKV